MIPTGLDPKEIYNSDWLLRQAFGDYIELEGNDKYFKLDIYNKGISQFNYDRKEVEAATRGMDVPIFVGRGRTGPVAYDMVKHPHLLIAGETGSGKSVCLCGIITTLLLFAGDRVDLYCCDMKRTEFHTFRGIAKNVVMEKTDLLKLLYRLDGELDKRGRLLDKAGVQHITDLPAFGRPKFIVIAIDEVIVLRGQKKSMEILERLTSLGRALGIFAILSMQRPDAKVIDGVLKNNLTVRMAFRHTDNINSRITIDSGEAAKIKTEQKGLMVHNLDGIKFAQSPKIDAAAARKLLAHLKDTADVTEPAASHRGKKAVQEPQITPEELEDEYKRALQELDDEEEAMSEEDDEVIDPGEWEA
jgi:S-DNA-T family DNA segregation ATPase FtsK/SpoIIIE